MLSSVHNFIMHQGIKLVFQQIPFRGRRHLSLHMTGRCASKEK